MKVLVAIINAHCRESWQRCIRETWLPLVPKDKADFIFFRGRGATREPKVDEVFLDCDDSYQGLPNKVQEIVRWSYARDYDVVCKCDDDVVMNPKAWLASGFENYDFVGCKEYACKPGEIVTPYGFFYSMSRKAMELVKDYPLPGEMGSTHVHRHNNDEAFFSTILHISGITLHHDPRYYLYRGSRPKSATRALRPISRPVPQEETQEVEKGTFAWCVYLMGQHEMPEEVILAEFKSLFQKYVEEKASVIA